jgi:hypothetical protein
MLTAPRTGAQLSEFLVAPGLSFSGECMRQQRPRQRRGTSILILVHEEQLKTCGHTAPVSIQHPLACGGGGGGRRCGGLQEQPDSGRTTWAQQHSPARARAYELWRAAVDSIGAPTHVRHAETPAMGHITPCDGRVVASAFAALLLVGRGRHAAGAPATRHAAPRGDEDSVHIMKLRGGHTQPY